MTCIVNNFQTKAIGLSDPRMSDLYHFLKFFFKKM